MSATGMLARLAIWLLAAVAATAAGNAAQFSRFNFPLSLYLLHTATAWAFARAAVLVLNLKLDLGDQAEHAATKSEDAGPSKLKQLMIAGLLLGGSMAAYALLQTIEASSIPATAVLKSCAPVLVLGISLQMHQQSPWPLWKVLLVLAISAGAGVASYEGEHIFWFWRSTSPFLQAAIAFLQASGIFLQAGSISMLQKALQPRADTLPHAMSLGGRTSSSGSSLLRTSSSASTSSCKSSSSSGCVSDEVDVVTPAGPSPLVVLTHIAWYAMLVLAAPALLLEAPKLVATFAGWKAALPTLLISSSTFTVCCLLTVAAVQATSALTVSLLEVTTAAAVSLGTALLYPWHSNFPAGIIPPMQWGGLAVAALGLALYAWGKVVLPRAGQLQRRMTLEAPIKTAAYWAVEDPAKVMKCSGTDAMVYIQPHRVRQVSAAPWVQQQKEGFRPLVAVQDVMEPRAPLLNLQQQQQQWQPQPQLVYCR